MKKSHQTQGLQVSGALPMVAPAPPALGSPVKVAVALGYVPETEHAPRVLAGGRGGIDEQFLNIAFAQGIRVREDPELAQLLATLDIDSEIPVQAFAAVAGILVYVDCVNGAATRTGEAGPDDASLDQPDQPLQDQPLLDRPLAERAKGPAG